MSKCSNIYVCYGCRTVAVLSVLKHSQSATYRHVHHCSAETCCRHLQGNYTNLVGVTLGLIYASTLQRRHTSMLEAMIYTGGDSNLDSDEAEYAWLSLDSLKPFREGDSLTAEDEAHVSDPTLTACIAAAERAVKAAADRSAAAAADAEQEGEDDDGAESLSDSDGGEVSCHPGQIWCSLGYLCSPLCQGSLHTLLHMLGTGMLQLSMHNA